jgi:hypothetical protein
MEPEKTPATHRGKTPEAEKLVAHKIYVTREELKQVRQFPRGYASKMFRAVLSGHRKDLPRNRDAVDARTHMAAQIARVGNNLNQISRAVNESMLTGGLHAEHAVKLQAALLLASDQLLAITKTSNAEKS